MDRSAEKDSQLRTAAAASKEADDSSAEQGSKNEEVQVQLVIK